VTKDETGVARERFREALLAPVLLSLLLSPFMSLEGGRNFGGGAFSSRSVVVRDFAEDFRSLLLR